MILNLFAYKFIKYPYWPLFQFFFSAVLLFIVNLLCTCRVHAACQWSMDGVRQRRHVADADSGDDVSEVVREEETDLLLTHYSSSHDDSLSSQSSKYLTEDPTIRLRSAKEDKDKQSSISPKDQDDEGKRRPEQPCDEETLWDIFFEVFLPFIVAGLGMATTGITLNYVKVRALMSFCSWWNK